MAQQINMTFPILWNHVRSIREEVFKALADQPETIRIAAMMTMSELVENAIKYGESVENASCVKASMNIDTERIQIVVQNGSSSEKSIQTLARHIDLIQSTEDKGELYLARLTELMAHPGGGSQLGLYRIAFEGGFDLTCNWSNKIVTMTATRRLP
ncbi:MAG TPA: hypothetical protein PKE31_09985 [Pseudomonadota bacterium]|nr:hypothetical protein [Pseudomonadota bacterium]